MGILDERYSNLSKSNTITCKFLLTYLLVSLHISSCIIQNQCENYVRVLSLRSRDQLLLTCGTNSYRPICAWLRPHSLSTVIPHDHFLSGDGKSPYNSQFPSAYELIETGLTQIGMPNGTFVVFCFKGELYSATSNEPVFGVNDPLIQRSFTEGKQLRTQQHDSNWLRSTLKVFSFRTFSQKLLENEKNLLHILLNKVKAFLTKVLCSIDEEVLI